MERLCNAPLTTCNAHRTTGKPSHAPIWRAVHGVQCGRAKVAPLPCARIDVGHLELSSSVMIKVVLC